MTDRELMQQALDALESMKTYAETAEPGLNVGVPIITALRDRLAQPEKEPVATVQCINGITLGYLEVMQPVGTKLYTSPPQRKPLTDNELADLWYKQSTDWMEFARAVEAVHGIKGEA